MKILRSELKLKERGLRYGYRVIYRLDPLQKLEQSMWQAGIYMRVSATLLLIMVLIGRASSLAHRSGSDPLIAIALGGVLGALPILYIKLQAQAAAQKVLVRNCPSRSI